jgi:hypothetical protein
MCLFSQLSLFMGHNIGPERPCLVAGKKTLKFVLLLACVNLLLVV